VYEDAQVATGGGACEEEIRDTAARTPVGDTDILVEGHEQVSKKVSKQNADLTTKSSPTGI